MLNKKGFTIAEVIVSFSLIAVILATIISATMYYRDKMKNEEVVTQLLDFKNSMTKIVYDDIIKKNITSVETCIGSNNCVNLIDKENRSHVLKIVEFDESTSTTKKGVYLSYDGIKYMLPDSDLGTGNSRVCDFVGVMEVDEYDNKLYKVKATFRHKDIDYQQDILFVIS